MSTIHSDLHFDVPAQRLFNAVLSPADVEIWTGAPAAIDATDGGAFSMFGGQIMGRNIELVPFSLIVQAWRVAAWPAGLYSVVKFEVLDRANGTDLSFDHAGYPRDAHDELSAGWVQMYWNPLTTFLSRPA